MDNKVELLSPAGDFETALYAFDAGADAVYCGLKDYSARAFAGNFGYEELDRLLSCAKVRGKKVYVAFNTLVDSDGFESAADTLSRIERLGPDAIIVQDLGVASVCRKFFPKLKLHASTQLVAHNLESVLAMGELGFERVVLARELSAEEISSIAAKCGGIELECFIHGALCYSVSGLCLFSAMEKNRSGNRGKCAYCCRLGYDDGANGKFFPFSMKDLRLGKDIAKVIDAGAVSLKIEGRMKSPFYVASVTRYYRDIIDGTGPAVTEQDLDTVFSRRTTSLFIDGRDADQDNIDSVSTGHIGAPIGKIKKITKDRDGRSFLRFHTRRALEKHDGLQFANPSGGKPCGFGITEMRRAISRSNAYEISAGEDVEILLPSGDAALDVMKAVKPGATVYCSMSNGLKRKFPRPSFRAEDFPGRKGVDFHVDVSETEISVRAASGSLSAVSSRKGCFLPAKDPEKNSRTVSSAFARLGGSGYFLSGLAVENGARLFAPASVLNELRRETVGKLDEGYEALRLKSASAAVEYCSAVPRRDFTPMKTVKIRAGQSVPSGNWDEIIFLPAKESSFALPGDVSCRIALPVFNAEAELPALRRFIRKALREGYGKWEASDLATLRILKILGVEDITADWTLYAFNPAALRELEKMGVKRFVASPENSSSNVEFLADCGFHIEFLSAQATPLFISLSAPAMRCGSVPYSVRKRDGLWITTRKHEREFHVPRGRSERYDISWSDLC